MCILPMWCSCEMHTCLQVLRRSRSRDHMQQLGRHIRWQHLNARVHHIVQHTNQPLLRRLSKMWRSTWALQQIFL